MKKLDLGNDKISKLIKTFAIPCVISMIVAALYNIVDQIFIGWSEAGAFGNAATNIVYPFTVIALAFALLIGDGASALFNLSLGAKDNKKASKYRIKKAMKKKEKRKNLNYINFQDFKRLI